jgi:hypothetical protein
VAIDLGKYMGRTFHEDLAFSLGASEATFWDAVYRKAFPNLIGTELVTDLEKQKDGIDRALYLINGNVLWVDEKVRREVYPDILLEHTSNVDRGTPGWMEKDLAMDYLAYAFLPTKVCYLFPWPLLRRAWLKYRLKWRTQYWDTVPGKTRLNGGRCYYTHSVAVPIDVLQRAVTTASIIDVSRELS